MKSFERKRNSSQVVIERPKLRPGSRCGKVQVSEKKIEGFSKLSEILAGAQGAIFELVESGRAGLEAKTGLWEIFSCLNNKIWKEVYKPGSGSGDKNELENVRNQLVEANLKVQDLKFRLQDFESVERKQDFFCVQAEVKKYKDENKKLLEELSEVTKEYLNREGKINELAKANNSLRQEISDFKIRDSQRERVEVVKGEDVKLEKENFEYWTGQVKYYKESLESLQEGTLEIQEKFMSKCRAFENLMKQNKELQDLLKKKNPKTKSVCRSNSRSSSYLPHGGIIKTKPKSRNLEIIQGENVKIISECSLKTEIFILKNSVESLKIDKNQLERLITREKVEKQEVLDHCNKFQENCEDLKHRLSVKDQETNELLRIRSENNEELEKINGFLNEKTERVDQLLKENKESVKSLESIKKKCSSLQKALEACEKEKENWMSIQQDYLNQLEVLKTHSRQIVDKDSISIQNELKCAKSLIIRNQAEINRLTKEKEMFLQELNHVRHEKFGNLNGESEEKIKDLENHIMNLKSLLEVKEKIIREYGIKQKIPQNEVSIKEYIEKIQELEAIIVKYKASVKEYQGNLNIINKEISILRAEFRLEKEKVLKLDAEVRQVNLEKQGLMDELQEKSEEKLLNEKYLNELKEENEKQFNEIKVLKSSYSICEQMLNKMEKGDNEILLKKQNFCDELMDMKSGWDNRSASSNEKIVKESDYDLDQTAVEMEKMELNYHQKIESLLREKDNLEKENEVLMREKLSYISFIEEKNREVDFQISEIMKINESEKEIFMKKLDESKGYNKTIFQELENTKRVNIDLESRFEILIGENSSFKNFISNLQAENFELQSQNAELNQLHSELLANQNSLITLNAKLTQEYKESLLLLQTEKLDLESEALGYNSQIKVTIKDLQDKNLILNDSLKSMMIEKNILFKENSDQDTKISQLTKNLSDKYEEIKSLKDLLILSESTNKTLKSEIELLKKEKNSVIQPLNEQNFPDPKFESQELLLKDLASTLDIFAAKIDGLTEEKALLQLESSEKSEEISRLDKELIMFKIEKQDLADSLSGGCSKRTGQFINGEIRELEERFKAYEQEIDSLYLENKLIGMLAEEKSEKLEKLTEKCEILKGYLNKAVKVVMDTTRANQVYEHNMMVNSEIFELFKSEQLSLVSRLKEVKKTIVYHRHSEKAVLKENKFTINM